MKYGEKSKVLKFQPTTRKRIVCQYTTATTTEPLPSLKESNSYWPTLLGAFIGLLYISILFVL